MKSRNLDSPTKPIFTLQETLFWGVVVSGSLYVANVNYLLFHETAELFSILVSGSIFAISWNSRRYFSNGYFTIIGVAYLWIGLVDLAHVMAYKGMPIFHDGGDTNMSAQLWIIGRFLESLSLLGALILIKKRLPAEKVMMVYFFITAAVLASIFIFDIFPQCFVEGQGLTTFKKTSEYFISFTLAASAFFLYRIRDNFHPNILKLLFSSIGLTIASELSFTFYISPYGISNWIGHTLKVLSFYLVYKAIIQTGIQDPFAVLFRDLDHKETELAEINSRLEQIVERRTVELAASEARFRTLATLSPVGIFQVDLDSNCTFVNQKWSDINGISKDEALGTGWVHTIHPDDLGYVFSSWDKSTQQQHPFLAEYRILRGDGEVTWVLGQSMKIQQPGQPVQGYVGAITDISTGKRREQELALAKESAEAASIAKSRFLSMMSHELRTPMNGILGMAQLLLLSEMTDEQKSDCEIIIKSGRNLTNILNDILDLAKVEARRQECSNHPFDIYQVISETTELFTGSAALKGIRLEHKIQPDICTMLIGDVELLRRCLVNLVGNGIKFTPSGEVVITVQLIEETAEQQFVQFKVQDTGIGIAKDLQETIFEPFRQADETNSRRYGGTGLGLAIVKQLTELMGGSIAVESHDNKGSCFHLKLWFGRDTQNTPIKKAFEPKRVAEISEVPLAALLVEDDPTNQKVITKLLSTLNIQCDLANDGEQALLMAQSSAYQMIFMDLLMPKKNGYEATESIRTHKDSLNRQTPIIALTAMASRQDRDKCFQAGMDAYITKPIDFKILQDTTHKFRPKI